MNSLHLISPQARDGSPSTELAHSLAESAHRRAPTLAELAHSLAESPHSLAELVLQIRLTSRLFPLA